MLTQAPHDAEPHHQRQSSTAPSACWRCVRPPCRPCPCTSPGAEQTCLTGPAACRVCRRVKVLAATWRPHFYFVLLGQQVACLQVGRDHFGQGPVHTKWVPGWTSGSRVETSKGSKRWHDGWVCFVLLVVISDSSWLACCPELCMDHAYMAPHADVATDSV